MKNGLITIEHIADFDDFDEIIDVRSPSEFAEDHVPGAINRPVLSDEQRIEVGTIYKQHSPFDAKRVGAAYVAENIAHHLVHSFDNRPKNWRPLIMCWRGGQRSSAMTLILRRIGWDATQLQGGYKEYRKLVVEELADLPRKLAFRVICGPTGSGKSAVLQALARQGQQVLDLEEVACHKGSVLGVLPDAKQPSQKMFETRLLEALHRLDPTLPVYVEAESRKIGSLHLPDALIETIRDGSCVVIEATFEARVAFLLRDYDYFIAKPSWLNSRLNELRKLQSHETVDRWKSLVSNGQWQELVGELLELHYDPLYHRSQNRNFSKLDTSTALATDDLSATGIEDLASRIAAMNP